MNEFYNFIIKEDSIIKKSISSSNSFKKKLRLIQYNAFLEWMYPYNKLFYDKTLELELINIAESFMKKKKYRLSGINSDILIASFLMDNVGLFQQYINFFIRSSTNFSIIVTSKIDKEKAKDTLQLLKENNINIFCIKTNNPTKKIRILNTTINKINPNRIWAHLIPNDCTVLVSINNFINCEKFFIVGNDHTFWLGKYFFDYFIEFRNFGISLAIERRCIPKEKILHIPYYPIINNSDFMGFPFEREGKIVGVSGANLYKYLVDPELKYFHIIKELLLENPDFIFCLCGWGNEKLVLDFISQNKLEGRFFSLGRRHDFYNLVGQSDILFESYPIKGGLTLLFATEQKIPVIGISSFDNISGSLEEFLNIDGYSQPTNFQEFKLQASQLIKDPNYRKWLAFKLSINKYNVIDFETSLNKIITKSFDELIPQKILPLKLNDCNNLQEYLNLENSTIENILRHKLFHLRASLSFFSRIHLLMPALRSVENKITYNIIRIIFLVIFGK